MRVQYDVMVQEFARVLEKKGFTHEDAENAAIIFAQNSLAGVYSHGLNRKIGNNPLIMAVPRSNGEHAMIDCAVSQFSYGKIEDCRLKGLKLPVPEDMIQRENSQQILQKSRRHGVCFRWDTGRGVDFPSCWI